MRSNCWAWVISIGVHLTALMVFGAVRFSGSVAEVRQLPIPAAKVNQPRNLPQTWWVIPRPKVKRSPVKSLAEGAERLLQVGGTFDAVKPGPRNPGSPGKCSVSQSSLWSPQPGDLSGRIWFFGSSAEERKVCYLVDCSGSMRGVFGRVCEELKESIGNLQPDQYFYIIFFGGEDLFEFGDGRLVRATHKAKSAAQGFIDSIQPAGQTNALPALERAMQIKDGQGEVSSIVYFLTDGFELTSENEQSFLQKASDLQRRFAPRTRVNTIGFWPQSSDRRMLEAIARQSGGEFVIVEGDA
ncbi:MAG TPA: VWA domain-containing protein [Sedimentisphaerales bacterium]|nr:VWA domain-containing protein [Sedimentisphaerales bacterium]